MSDSLNLGMRYGWVGLDSESPELQRQRELLAHKNGITGLEIVTPDRVQDAKRIFYRDGFVVVSEALTGPQLRTVRDGCARVIAEIMTIDTERQGNRGSHRYSLGSASKSGHQVHQSEWAMLIDLPTVTPILEAIFESPDYICRGGGGDFCLPGAVDYQPLHSDVGDRREIADHAAAADNSGSKTSGAFWDPRGLMTIRDLPCPYVCCNFLMTDFTSQNGPTRQIPGTQNSRQQIPGLDEEPDWMKFSTICPAAAGSVLIRDPRAWHGGTPNLSNELRAIPNIEYYAPWFREPMALSMPTSVYQTLSDHGQRICRYIVSDRDVDGSARPDLGHTPKFFT
ncbi:MAG: phytanoyl-CoA dioxygenase family protein [Acidimicrobiales bacterium]|nr:phytanoyl-CoA dioxygenase family protein [Acidimicrobiales bacterium]